MDKTLHWTNHWEKIAAQIERQPDLLLATDFDGTLAPIARTPAEAHLPPEVRAVLRRLAACRGNHLAVISGRALSDVQLHVGVAGIYYVGNHGLELSGPGLEMHNARSSRAHWEMTKAVTLLVEATAGMEGVFVEDKHATAAVHWRLAGEETRCALEKAVLSTMEDFPRLDLREGKCVWEIRPKGGWNKGDALLHLATRFHLPQEAVVYLGDDVTDEDAFRAAPDSMTFRIGSEHESSAANYRVRDAADVRALLLCILGLLSKRQLSEKGRTHEARSAVGYELGKS